MALFCLIVVAQMGGGWDGGSLAVPSQQTKTKVRFYFKRKNAELNLKTCKIT